MSNCSQISGLQPFIKPQYPHTNSANWSLYISLKNKFRKFNKRSKIVNDLFVINLLILLDFALDNQWILLGENWCWSLLGLKGLTVQSGAHNQSGTVETLLTQTFLLQTFLLIPRLQIFWYSLNLFIKWMRTTGFSRLGVRNKEVWWLYSGVLRLFPFGSHLDFHKKLTYSKLQKLRFAFKRIFSKQLTLSRCDLALFKVDFI